MEEYVARITKDLPKLLEHHGKLVSELEEKFSSEITSGAGTAVVAEQT